MRPETRVGVRVSEAEEEEEDEEGSAQSLLRIKRLFVSENSFRERDI